MTNEEAIKEMECMKETFINLHTESQLKKKENKKTIIAYDMAIEALKQNDIRKQAK